MGMRVGKWSDKRNHRVLAGLDELFCINMGIDSDFISSTGQLDRNENISVIGPLNPSSNAAEYAVAKHTRRSTCRTQPA
jgi:hypothetical protein